MKYAAMASVRDGRDWEFVMQFEPAFGTNCIEAPTPEDAAEIAAHKAAVDVFRHRGHEMSDDGKAVFAICVDGDSMPRPEAFIVTVKIAVDATIGIYDYQREGIIGRWSMTRPEAGDP